jgi:hypothetical protein
MIGGSQIIAPSGEIVALCVTEEDELITARCDLDQCAPSKSTVSNFGLHREPPSLSPDHRHEGSDQSGGSRRH